MLTRWAQQRYSGQSFGTRDGQPVAVIVALAGSGAAFEGRGWAVQVAYRGQVVSASGTSGSSRAAWAAARQIMRELDEENEGPIRP